MYMEINKGPTSIKELFQGMIPDSSSVLRGQVIQESPLQIQIIGDDKLVLHTNIICLPRHLSDYTTEIDIELGGGSINSHTHLDGKHPHGLSGGHSQYSGSGLHEHPSTEGAHINWLQDFNVYGAKIKVYNSLKVGELVYILSFNEGKKYYILDREEAVQ